MEVARGDAAPLSALVARVDFGSCLLLGADGVLIEAKVRAGVMGRRKALGNTLVVGDVARYDLEEGRALVNGVEPRRNAFSRRATSERVLEQVVATNLDQVVLVASIVA